MQFNDTKETVEERTETTNYEGGEAYEPDSPEVALYKNVINNLLEDSFYETAQEAFDGVEDAFNECVKENPEYPLKLAKYARQEENLRQIPQALLVLSAEHRPAEDGEAITEEYAAHYVRAYGEDIMSRADEPLDVLAFWVERNGRSVPNFLARSIEDAMHNWNEWQYAKWDQPNKEWQYRDLLNLVHPKPRDDERERVFEKIAHGDLSDYEVEPLKQEDTWESSLSDDSDDRSKAEKYREELEEDEDGYSMGLFPRIRQARDMLESGISAEEIYGEVDDEWIRNSRLYPFRFYQAYKAVAGNSQPAQELSRRMGLTEEEPDIPESERREALDFLEHAMQVSTENLPDILEDTFVAVDISGSMHSSVSNNSDLECVEISTLFGALVYERGADLAAFASDIQEYHGDRRDSVMTNMKSISELGVGGGTNGHLIPQALRENDRNSYNQIVVFTDMQMWQTGGGLHSSNGSFKEEWRRYKQEVNPDASLYLVDLASYGDLVTPETERDVYNLSGWSENVIDYIDKMERTDEMVRIIEAVEPAQTL